MIDQKKTPTLAEDCDTAEGVAAFGEYHHLSSIERATLSRVIEAARLVDEGQKPCPKCGAGLISDCYGCRLNAAEAKLAEVTAERDGLARLAAGAGLRFKQAEERIRALEEAAKLAVQQIRDGYLYPGFAMATLKAQIGERMVTPSANPLEPIAHESFCNGNEPCGCLAYRNSTDHIRRQGEYCCYADERRARAASTPAPEPEDDGEHRRHPAGDYCSFCLSQWPCAEAIERGDL